LGEAVPVCGRLCATDMVTPTPLQREREIVTYRYTLSLSLSLTHSFTHSFCEPAGHCRPARRVLAPRPDRRVRRQGAAPVAAAIQRAAVWDGELREGGWPWKVLGREGWRAEGAQKVRVVELESHGTLGVRAPHHTGCTLSARGAARGPCLHLHSPPPLSTTAGVRSVCRHVRRERRAARDKRPHVCRHSRRGDLCVGGDVRSCVRRRIDAAAPSHRTRGPAVPLPLSPPLPPRESPCAHTLPVRAVCGVTRLARQASCSAEAWRALSVWRWHSQGGCAAVARTRAPPVGCQRGPRVPAGPPPPRLVRDDLAATDDPHTHCCCEEATKKLPRSVKMRPAAMRELMLSLPETKRPSNFFSSGGRSRHVHDSQSPT
jgi:hypothetical protein